MARVDVDEEDEEGDGEGELADEEEGLTEYESDGMNWDEPRQSEDLLFVPMETSSVEDSSSKLQILQLGRP